MFSSDKPDLCRPLLLLCGPQTELPNIEITSRLHQVLVVRGMAGELQHAVENFSTIFRKLISEETKLKGASIPDELGCLYKWLERGDPGMPVSALPATVTLPLTIILQVAQFIERFDEIPEDELVRPWWNATQPHGVQGFCAGFLTAAAIAFSNSYQDLVKMTTISVRLAMCIGIYIEADRLDTQLSSQACAISIRWRKEDLAINDITEILNKYESAYISCTTDDACLTITVSKHEKQDVMAAFRMAGCRVKTVDISGRYHSSLVHSTAAKRLEAFCRDSDEVQYPNCNDLRAPLRSNVKGRLLVRDDVVTNVAIDSILLYQADWYGTVKEALRAFSTASPAIAILGFEESVLPLSLTNQVFGKLEGSLASPEKNESDCSRSNSARQPNDTNRTPDTSTTATSVAKDDRASDYPSNSVAIVGMACRFPGADSVEDFWKLLASGRSMVQKAPGRLNLVSHRIMNRPEVEFWGNFIEDVEAFDHRFFKKTAREAVSWDPAMRMLLQVSYQALESAGYFAPKTQGVSNDYGCFFGAVANNYYDNVACHPPTAYSMLGTSRGFFSGQVSHHFNFTGPALTIDTACSSSLVAINAACRAIQAGECSRALAGGTNIITSPFDYQNLAAAGFLSPTGACKPFDASADGYCRGEGVGVVVLKSLAAAQQEHDDILGVIVGSAVNQNLNDGNITVPCGPSQIQVYDRVLRIAERNPSQVTYVEAHGTGTQVGDPIEYQSIRQAFASSHREKALFLGSVKGNIGHTEATSGVAGLIKVLLMMQKETIPGQANFETLNPKISALGANQIEIPKQCQPWMDTNRLAFVNSYGAAGSNAAIAISQIVTKTPPDSEGCSICISRLPFVLAAASKRSISTYCQKLLDFVRTERSSSTDLSQLLFDILFTLSNRTNHMLPHTIAQTVTNLEDLEGKLENFATSHGSVEDCNSSNPPPCILVFGGQESDYVGLSEEIYKDAALLRFYLDKCDAHLRSLGHQSLYPSIFQRSTISDLPLLHAMLFAVQYSSAKCWMDCGLQISALIGHSFGQLSALCASGSLSLLDGLRFVVGRAELINRCWGTERGKMVAMQADVKTVSDILLTLNARSPTQHRLEIACYNSPSNHVVVGCADAISSLEKHVANDAKLRDTIPMRRLKVTHGFHSALANPLLPGLRDLSSSLHWNKPEVPVQLCSEDSEGMDLDADMIVAHTQKPVFFQPAVEQLAQKFANCIWVEAGQRTSVLSLVQSCLAEQSEISRACFPSVLSSRSATSALADLNVSLWKVGCRTRFWLFSRVQQQRNRFKNIPPYQFERSKHWLPFVDRASIESNQAKATPEQSQPKHGFFSFLGFEGKNEKIARFLVDPESDRYKMLLEGHTTSGQALAPISLYIELLQRSAIILAPQASSPVLTPVITQLQMESPVGLNISNDILVILTQTSAAHQLSWSFVVLSRSKLPKNEETVHARGRVNLTSRDNTELNQTMKRFGSLIGFDRCVSILNASDAEKMQGNHIYQAIEKLVRFDRIYQGIKCISCTGCEAVARVIAEVNPERPSSRHSFDTPVIDSLMQLAGILVNYFRHPSNEEILVCIGIDQVIASGSFDITAGVWLTYALLTEDTEQRTQCDVYVFDVKMRTIAIAFLGFSFVRASISAMARRLRNANGTSQLEPKKSAPDEPISFGSIQTKSTPTQTLLETPRIQGFGKPSTKQELKNILHSVTDVPLNEIADHATLPDLGIDSLLVTEVLNEIQDAFKIEIDLNQFLFFPNVAAIYRHVDSLLGISTDGEEPQAASQSNLNDQSISESGLALNIRGQSAPVIRCAQDSFRKSKYVCDRFVYDTEAANFWNEVYPRQAKLVLGYVLEGFAALGCDVKELNTGNVIPDIPHLPRHRQLVRQLFRVLEDAKLLTSNRADKYVRTSTPAPLVATKDILPPILTDFPQHATVHRIVSVIGSELAPCLTGSKDGLQLVFGNKGNKQDLDDIYENWPLVRSGTLTLGDFLGKLLSSYDGSGEFRILEVGAGTGGTTKYIVEHLQELGIPFRYVFTDLSPSLVNQAKRTFKRSPVMDFSVFDVEKEPDPSMLNSFHVIISTNCIHATRNLTHSLSTLRRLLRDDGVLALVEITRNMFWLDIAVGLFEGWWLFEDGRGHAIADEERWRLSLLEAGFAMVDWTDGETLEARTIRVIVGFASKES